MFITSSTKNFEDLTTTKFDSDWRTHGLEETLTIGVG